MSLIQHFVSPRLPTALANDTHVDLPGHDAWLYYIDNVHVIPTELDVSKFEDALSSTLQLYPHAAGQLRRTDGSWSIELTNTTVPVNIEYKRNMSSDSLLDGTWVVQQDLSPLLNQHPIGANSINTSAPLLRLKLTFFDRETCIGVTWNHSLGDAIMMSRFMHMLSQFYQGLPPEYAVPTFEKYHFPAPTHSMKAELLSCMPLHPISHFDEVAFAEGFKDLEHVTWRIDSHDLEDLRSTLSERQNKRYLSIQDCLTAYCVAVLNENNSHTVQRIRNVCSYRHISAPFIPGSVAGNLILFVPVGVPVDMAGIASAIRDALIQSREPNCIYLLESVKSEHMLEAANAGKPLPVSFPSDELLVDSTTVIDWCSAHFGFPDGTRFHTAGYIKYCLRCFRPNPEKGEDGVWRARQSLEMSIGASAESKLKILETLARGVRYMLDNQHVQV